MSDDLKELRTLDHQSCPVCKDLLAHMQRFFEMLEDARRASTSDWLTVDDVAGELRISKSIVYRLIHHGEIEAVNIVDGNGRMAQRGHYRIQRSSLTHYLESKKVRPFPPRAPSLRYRKQFPKVKNHLGL